jgi:glycosyltransferase involved in cell wall biosynthesis
MNIQNSQNKISVDKPKSISMIAFFTYALSMTVWKRSGLIDREIGYYQFLHKEGIDKISFLTYGCTDKQYQQEIGLYKILPKVRYCSNLLFGLIAPLLYFREFQSANIYKSNQVQGAWVGLIAKLFKPSSKFIVRAGWIPTRDKMRKDRGYNQCRIRHSEFIQNLSYRFSDLIIVTTKGDKNYLCNQFHIPMNKIQIVPNCIDIGLFYPMDLSPHWREAVKVISVGRQVKMKNFQSIILGIQGIRKVTELLLVGEGPHRQELQQLVKRTNTPVRFMNFLPNNELPAYLHNSHIFIMPQLYGTGMSKGIIEAMACGLIVVASDIPAHREVIRNGENGFLCGTEPEAIRLCLQKILNQSHTKLANITRKAIQDALNHYSMQANAHREFTEILALFKT